jgi:hypothetical protein
MTTKTTKKAASSKSAANASKTTTSKPAKAKSGTTNPAKAATKKAPAKKPADEKATPANEPVATPESNATPEPAVDPCAAGHVWDMDSDGVEHCTVCLADRAVIEKPAKGKKGKAKDQTARATKDEAATAPSDAAAPTTKAKATKTPKADRKLSAIDAAAKVLAESTEPMNAKQMIEAMAAKGLWTSPGGKTPHATLYSAILREIATKGNEARFKKTDRGQFAANG